MKVVIRVESSLKIGTGHVMRCLTLAEELLDRGAHVSFICREYEGHLCDLIESRGFEVHRLAIPPAECAPNSSQNNANWFAVDFRQDAEDTLDVIQALGCKPDWLIVDHYELDKQWEGLLRMSAERIFVIDDLADRQHNCDLLLDQNLVAEMQTRYEGKVPDNCGLMLGSDYALLQSVYVKWRNRMRLRGGPIKRLCVFFGGVDQDNLTGMTIAAFQCLNRPEIILDVVVGVGCPHELTIREQIKNSENIHLYSGLPTLAPLLAEADLAIGGSGATSWERLCLGLPAVVVSLSDNQHPIAEELGRLGLICWLGRYDQVDEKTLMTRMEQLIRQGLSTDWLRRCASVVDGCGVSRIGEVLTVSTNTPLLVRPVTPEDEGLLLGWANDPVTRKNAFSTNPISADTHHHWLSGKLADNAACRLYIVESIGALPLGQVRFEHHENIWEVHYAISPLVRGRGLGRSVLSAALETFCKNIGSTLIYGQVKLSNIASSKVFESLGFDVVAEENSDVIVYERRL